MSRLLAFACVVVCLSTRGFADPPLAVDKPSAFLEGHERALAWLKFSQTGNTLFSGGWGDAVRIWDLSKPRPVFQSKINPDNRVFSADLSPDGSCLLTVGQWQRDESPVVLWDWTNQSVKWKVDREAFAKITHGTLYSGKFSPDGKQIVLGTAFEFPSVKRNGRAVLIDAETGKLIRVLRSGAVVPEAEFSPDGQFIAISGGDTAGIEIVDAETSQRIAMLSGAKGFFTWDLLFSPDWSTLVTSGGEVHAYVWDLPKFSRVPSRRNASAPASLPQMKLRTKIRVSRRVNRTDPPTLAVSPDSRLLATGAAKEGVSLWDIQTGELLTKITWPPAPGYKFMFTTAMAFSPDGKMLAVGGKDRVIRLFDLPTELWPGQQRKSPVPKTRAPIPE